MELLSGKTDFQVGATRVNHIDPQWTRLAATLASDTKSVPMINSTLMAASVSPQIVDGTPVVETRW